MNAPAYHPLYLDGIERFNRGEYFESHEIWEGLWRGESGPVRNFYKGLIQAAVALHHWRDGNAAGGATLWARSRSRLRRYSPLFLGLNVDRFMEQMAKCLAAPAPVPGAPGAEFPTIRLESGGCEGPGPSGNTRPPHA